MSRLPSAQPPTPTSTSLLTSTTTMRSQLLRLRRAFSTAAPTPLINVHTVPAPHTGKIKLLTLNRPTAKNAISRALLKELSDHVSAIHSGKDKETRVLVIGSEVDGVFCAGADLKVSFYPLPSTLLIIELIVVGTCRVYKSRHRAIPIYSPGNTP